MSILMKDKYRCEDIFVKPYSEDDLDEYLSMLLEEDIYQKYDFEQIKRITKELMTDNSRTINYSVFIIPNMIYCGNIELQKCDDGYSLGIKLKKQYRNRGIGKSAIIYFCNEICIAKGIESLIIRIQPDNLRSKHVFEKLGARFSERKLSPEFEKLYKETNRSITEETIIQLGAVHYILELPISNRVKSRQEADEVITHQGVEI